MRQEQQLGRRWRLGNRSGGEAGGASLPVAVLFPLFFAAVYLAHLTLLRLPYFWDEGGYYIPAALDFFRTGTLIPQTTLTNAHPPLPSIFLAGWWHLSGFVPSGTRTLLCLVTAAALVGVFRLARGLAGSVVAWVVTLLTAAYPIWFAQSTLAHADMFAAAFTVWGLSIYLTSGAEGSLRARWVWAAGLFSLAALSKETAVVTPVALAVWEAWLWARRRWQEADPNRGSEPRHAGWVVALLLPVLPLLGWYGYHWHRTGFVFGNPEFLRYNATANLTVYRFLLCLWHRLLHLTMHMNLFVPVLGTLLVLVLWRDGGWGLSRRAAAAIAVVLMANWVEFSVLGGALLTRYLLPMYPLVLLLCVAAWKARLGGRTPGDVAALWGLAAVSAAAFLVGIFVNPPYAFAPEDNLTYRDMVVLHQAAVRVIAQQFPGATVLTAWPGAAELGRPELGYTRVPVRVVEVKNFSRGEMERAAAERGSFDTAMVFSTKWVPGASSLDVARRNRAADARYFDFHEDMRPDEVARRLGGTVVWEAQRGGEWAGVVRFPRSSGTGAGGAEQR